MCSVRLYRSNSDSEGCIVGTRMDVFIQPQNALDASHWLKVDQCVTVQSRRGQIYMEVQ